MKILERKNFLQKLINSINTPDIKVITGIRRSGKSKLLEGFIEYLKRNIPNANIIHINYNLFQFSTLKNAAALNEYVENLYSPEKENFLLIDEVQLCKDFEQAINSFHASEKFHIYITGSNAFLLSNDLATLFTGRTFSVEVFHSVLKSLFRTMNVRIYSRLLTDLQWKAECLVPFYMNQWTTNTIT